MIPPLSSIRLKAGKYGGVLRRAKGRESVFPRVPSTVLPVLDFLVTKLCSNKIVLTVLIKGFSCRLCVYRLLFWFLEQSTIGYYNDFSSYEFYNHVHLTFVHLTCLNWQAFCNFDAIFIAFLCNNVLSKIWELEILIYFAWLLWNISNFDNILGLHNQPP